jgi:hypothetical protein
MKNILLGLVLVFVFGPFQVTYAADAYQCIVTSTRASGCEAYYEIKHTCPFPQELNEARAKELIHGKPSYPDFCHVCGSESNIPKHCQSGRISTFVSTPVSNATPHATNDSIEPVNNIQNNSILQNAYQGFKITAVRVWEWFKVVSKGEDFELKGGTTPVAGVRG